jgi:hypothetical protein
MKSHLEFKEVYTGPSYKTKVFDVFSNFDKSHLGRIQWNGGWRCYVLHTFSGIIWSWDCLLECSNFIKALNETHKLQLKIKVKK